MTGCQTGKEAVEASSVRAEQARQEQKSSELVKQAIDLTRKDVMQPKECGVRIQSGIQVGERLDVALTKASDALYRANNRLVRCYKFNETARGK